MNGDILRDGLDKLLGKLEVWGEQIIQMLPNMIIAVLVISIFWALSRWIHNLLTQLFARTHLNRNLEQLLANVGRLLVLGLGFIICLSVLNLEKTVFSLLAGVGVIGLALGFAFQDLAANFISGIMLAVRAPIQIGDMIDIRGSRGTVTEINLRDTVLRTSSGQDIYMPNKDFTSNAFTNFSRSGRRRIDLEVGISYDDDIESAKAIILKAVDGVDGLLKDPPPDIYVNALGESAVVIRVDVFYKYPGGSINALTGATLTAIKNALDSAKITIAYPTRTLQFPKEFLDSIKARQTHGESAKNRSAEITAGDRA